MTRGQSTLINDRIMREAGAPTALPYYVSTVRPATVIRLETGQDEDGIYSWFVRIYTARVVTFEEKSITEGRGRDRFEAAVEKHVQGENV